MVGLPIKITDLPTRADSQQMWRQHELKNTGPMLETKALFRSWGAEVFFCTPTLSSPRSRQLRRRRSPQPIAFPNHGFWSISPTAFYDFYQSQGFKLGTSYAWRGVADSEGLVPRLRRIDPFKIGDDFPAPCIGSFVFRKWNEPVNAHLPRSALLFLQQPQRDDAGLYWRSAGAGRDGKTSGGRLIVEPGAKFCAFALHASA